MLNQAQVDEQPNRTKLEIRELGKVESVRKFIVTAQGLPSCINGQIVEFEKGTKGIVMGFKEDKVQILALGTGSLIRNGDEIYNRGEPLTLPVGDKFIGRIVSGIAVIFRSHMLSFQFSGASAGMYITVRDFRYEDSERREMI